MGALDRVLSAFGLQRRARRSYFDGAAMNRLTADWIMSSVSADRELRSDLKGLRARSRELARNNDFYARYLRLCEANVVGPSGFTLQAHVPGASPDREDVGANRIIEDGWDRWRRRGVCTVDGRLSLVDAQRLFIRTVEMDGECFVRLVRGFPSTWGFALQFLDASQLDLAFSQPAAKGRNEIRMGVELDTWARPIAYHFWTADPSEGMGLVRERIPAAQIIHGYDPRRVNQTRGLPACHSCMSALNMLGGYMEAEVVAARTAASKMGWFVAESGEPLGEDSPRPAAMEATPGLIDSLPPGYDFKAWDPQHPTSGFGEFLKACLRSVASGLGVSYVDLASDLEAVNYSSIRAGRLTDYDLWRVKQGWMVEAFLRPVYAAWLDMALLTGMVRLPARDFPRFLNVEFQARGWQWVDPLKEVQANIAAVAAGFKTVSQVVAEQGGDLEALWRQRKKELDLASGLGLTFGSAPASPTGADTQPSQGADQAEPDEDDALDGRGMRELLEAAQALRESSLRPPEIREITVPPAPLTLNLTVEAAKPGKRTVQLVRDGEGRPVAAEITDAEV